MSDATTKGNTRTRAKATKAKPEWVRGMMIWGSSQRGTMADALFEHGVKPADLGKEIETWTSPDGAEEYALLEGTHDDGSEFQIVTGQFVDASGKRTKALFRSPLTV